MRTSVSKPRKSILDTLAQSGTGKAVPPAKTAVVVRGNGSDLLDSRLMLGRGKRKMIGQKLIHNLLKVAEKECDQRLITELWNAHYCQHKIITANERAFSPYCKTRFCPVCLGNRKAQIIKAYLPIVKTWECPQLVTLTSRAVTRKYLNQRMNNTLRALRIIIERYRKRNQRNKGNALKGIRSLECNFNPLKRTYNVHLHLIVPDKATAEILKRDWLKLWTWEHAGSQSQHIRAVDNMERDLIEVVKYGSKVFTQPDPDKKKKGKEPALLYAKAFYNILKAMKGHRLFDRFGFNLNSDRKAKSTGVALAEYQEWEYDSKRRDWTNEETDETLTKYLPPPELIEYLIHDVNLTHE